MARGIVLLLAIIVVLLATVVAFIVRANVEHYTYQWYGSTCIGASPSTRPFEAPASFCEKGRQP